MRGELTHGKLTLTGFDAQRAISIGVLIANFFRQAVRLIDRRKQLVIGHL
jgi:hypothetical protein